MFEVEQKFPMGQPAAMEAALRHLGAKFSTAVVQIDRYFAHPARDFARTDEALRIRQVGERNLITYKGAKLDSTTKTRREIELPLAEGAASAEQWASLLIALGFAPAGVVRKTRRAAGLEFGGWHFDIALDEVDELGNFIELELAGDEGNLDAARDALAQLAARLGLAQNERRSYLELLLERQT
jgi:adenylate cyclase class 2